MVILKRHCFHSNGSSAFLNVAEMDTLKLVTSLTMNASDEDLDILTPSRPGWEVDYELLLGPNVTCLTEELTLPREMTFTEDNMFSVVAYCCLFVVSLVGNLMVFTTLWGSRHSRVNLCILHLSIADLFVACVFLPLETTWHITVSWRAGDIACRICMALRAFGFYLSSNIIMVIAIDRYMSIVHPMMLSGSIRRCKIMLVIAYVVSLVYSLPQSIIFHIERHPNFPWFLQCVTFNFFQNDSQELAYDMFSFVAVYVNPLLVIVMAYTLILIKLSRQQGVHEAMTTLSKSTRRQWRHPCIFPPHKQLISHGSVTSYPEVRWSTASYLSNAKMRTLKMTSCIVGVFILCWTPYFAIILYHWIAKESAKALNDKVKRVLFIFAVSNSCMDPLVYGKT
ncbi:adipokinetic hormone/corazonin-related peptide receptor variant I-like [Biomphalaria glabrata]|uniref:Adipokinetic hormone/corazonin-related peptide receptor variant I-like n=1 Tax=Biomphalaria glabrata TaxID=6526 RepID=A0A9W3BGM8_BIOGL|nr:adipokinetic hormone/corazonin-related peptide receptor variant I-like [Biomphalaria glabrata]